MKNLQRDEIDFGKMNIPKLFFKLFIPTILGMVFMTAFNIIDGIFVGKGVSSDALAAVNIAAPIFLFSSAVSLMFASGVSIVAAVHLSQGNVKAANINITQSFIVPFILMAILAAIVFFFPERLNVLFGGSEQLLPLVKGYLRGIYLYPILGVFLMVGSFVIRLDGSPKVAMYVSIVPALLNIFLDWLFIFPLQKGVWGAAVATVLAQSVGVIMVLTYLFKFSKTVHFYRLKWTRTSLYLMWRNVRYMMKLGLSTFVGEVVLAAAMIVGNYMFIRYLHEDGVAAYSVACYLFPLIFMFGNSIVQSQLPVLSFNKGLGDFSRIRKTIQISIVVGIIASLLITASCTIFCDSLMTLFLDRGTNAHAIATRGFPYFALGFAFITLNLIGIGIYQGLEKANSAIAFMFLRGLVFVVPSFLLVPTVLGEKGLWLAIPIAEALTFIVIVLASVWNLSGKKLR